MSDPAMGLSLGAQSFLRWEAASRDTIDVKRIYIDVSGEDLVAGVLLSQIIYWHLPRMSDNATRVSVEKDGKFWLVKKREDWWGECRISPKQFDRASTQLASLGLIETQLFRWNGSPTVHIYLNVDKLLEGVNSILTKGENGNGPLGKMTRASRIPDSSEFLTETTTEIENPPKAPQGARTQKKTSSAEAESVVWYLNELNNRHYEKGGQIQKLLNTGVSVDDCKLVIDFGLAVLKVERPEWYGQYFDNVTPFRPDNFDKYRARAREWQKRRQSQPLALPPQRLVMDDGEPIIVRKLVI